MRVLFATQVAIAVKNVRLHSHTELRLQEQIALRQAGTAISSALDLETVLTSIADQVARIIDATSAYEYLEHRFGIGARVYGNLAFLIVHFGKMACRRVGALGR